MNSIKKLLKSIPFSSYFKRIDPAISRRLSLKNVRTIPVIVTFRRPVDAQLETRLKRMGFRVKYHLPFINAITGKIHAGSFDSISSVIEISKIYFDGTAYLMGSSEHKKHNAEPIGTASFKFSGKGVTAAFVDSGVYPHPDLVKPRNRIIAFKDYINELDAPYDDNGHGTACIGAAFGASVDGKFKTAAFDCNIVCAKAFNSLGYGCYSDILAAMQWICSIREKENIRVAVLPFGSCEVHDNFDILSLASESLWKEGIFVSTCSGNLGPYEGTISSPGVCSSSFTTGACTISGASPQVARFSGRGPVRCSTEKPEAVMPGFRVTTLNADINYIPRSKSYLQAKLSGQHYTEISGTSVAASMTAAAAVLLYQKKPNLSPEDVKSILKRLCTSINEPKSSQGAGMLDMKKIEEFL